MKYINSSSSIASKRIIRAVFLAIFLIGIVCLRIIRSEDTKISSININANAQKSLDKLSNYPQLDTTKRPLIYANSYAVMDFETGEMIFSKNPSTKVAVASTTKMTTALVARQVYKLDDVLTVKSGPYVQGSKIDLEVNEKITVENLLKGLLIQSGNDAAITLAEGLSTESGDVKAFVTKMNEYTATHHLNSTNFKDPAGLDDTGYSTAADLTNIGRLLLQDSVLAEIVRTPSTTVTSTNGLITHELKNSNRLLLNDNQFYLPGTLGIKTGFTYDAGHCLVSAYTISDRKVVASILNTNESTITASAEETYKLYKWLELHLGYHKY